MTNPPQADCNSAADVVKLRVVPPPQVASVVPDLECVAQDAQAMKVTGEGFIELGTTLPTVQVGTKSYPATAASGCTPIEGTYAEGVAQACTSLDFEIPVNDLPEGDYPVTVTNPPPADCVSTEAINLHIAPPPIVDSLATPAICDDQADQTIVINGSKLLRIAGVAPSVDIGGETFVPTDMGGCQALPGTYSEGEVDECTSLTIVVPQGTFTSGDYPVVVTNPPPADCHSTATISLHVEDPPRVDSVLPATVCAGGGTFEIQGAGFVQTPTVRLDSAGQPSVPASSVTWNSDTDLTAQFAMGAQVGSTYDVVVTNPDGCDDRPLPHKTVTVVPGPVVFFVDPEVVYSGINTRATVYATALTLPLPADAVWITPTGQAAPQTDLAWTVVPGKNRVQVIIPQGQPAGVYDLYLNDATGCSTMLPGAITVTDSLTVSLKSILPPFGWKNSETPVTLFRDTTAPAPADKPFVPTPRAFLNPSNPAPTDVAIPLESVAFVDGDTLTAVVPANEPVHAYDLIVVDPDGSVGLLPNAFNVLDQAPPDITSATPSSIPDAAGQNVVVAGTNFRDSTGSLTCEDGAGNTVTAPAVQSAAPVCDANQNCTQALTIDGSGLPAGAVCVLRMTNADGSWAEYSAIGVTTPSLNLSAPQAGPELNVGRRALVASAAQATSAARFLYAIGGDDGAATPAAFDSGEFAAVDVFGKVQPWHDLPYSLGTKRSLAGSATIGRYVYVFGGTDGSSVLASGERAMVLNPREVPKLDVVDIVPADQGLEAGYWYYRVSAVFAANDPDNPGGESLPSDEFIVKVPTFTNKLIQVVLQWTAPVDSLGQPLPNVVGYRVYRTPTLNGTSGQEVLLQEITNGTTLTWTDDDTANKGTATPLPLGSTGKWAPLAPLNTARKGLAGAWAPDPADPTIVHVYAALGLDSANNALASYEHLAITLQPNGHQSAGSAWTTGTQQSVQARWQLGAWVADHTTSNLIPQGDTWVYLGGGITPAGASAKHVEAGKVQAGGDLGALSDTPADFNGALAGYGVCAANGQLFAFGGANASPSNKAKSAELTTPLPALASGAWNDEGLTMTHGRYLMGSSVQSAFIFLVGGQTDEPSPASKTTELVIW